MQDKVNYEPQYIEEDEINLMEYISKLWKNKAMIIKWCIVGAILGLIVGFSLPKTYTAKVSFAPETQQRSNSSVSSIASIMGVNLNQSVDAISIDMFPDVVHSTPFIVDLFDLPVSFDYKGETITTSLLEYMKDYQKSPWWNSIIKAPFKLLDIITSIGKDEKISSDNIIDPTNLPEEERGVVDFFANNILVNIDKKTSKITMSIDLQDPQVVATVMNAIVDNLKEYISNYRTSKSRQDVDNLQIICNERREDYYKAQKAYAKFVDENKNVILQSAHVERERLQQEMNLAYQVYSQVATQLEGARIQVQQDKPVFTIISPVTVPLYKTAPSKAKILILMTFIAGCFAAAWVLFGKEIFGKIKEDLSN